MYTYIFTFGTWDMRARMSGCLLLMWLPSAAELFSESPSWRGEPPNESSTNRHLSKTKMGVSVNDG